MPQQLYTGSIPKYQQYRDMIQGYKIQCHVTSMDFNNTCTHFATGGRDSIRIFGIDFSNKCWFDLKKTYAKYKGTTITRACVSQLAWNKQGRETIAIGTTSGLVLAYDTVSPHRNILQEKAHQGNIKNVEWFPRSRDRFISASFQNQIKQWDLRNDRPGQKFLVGQYQLAQNTKIRDVKFNPHRPELMAVQSSTKLELIDIRRGVGSFKKIDILATYQIENNQMQGIGVQWDPFHPHRIASAISKEIKVFDVSGSHFQLTQGVSHYSLIKQFYWMKTKPSFFGILGEHPEKNLFFYDLQDKNRMAYMYGGHGRSIDCWKMDNKESFILSASNQRQRSKGSGSTATSFAFLVAQYTDNLFDPNEAKYNYPISFDNNDNTAFCLNVEESVGKKTQFQLLKKRSYKSKQLPPVVFTLDQRAYWLDIANFQNIPKTLKEEVIFLSQNYIIDASNQQISMHNSQVARKIGKVQCAQVWKNLFLMAYPPEEEQLTLEAIYQRKLKLNISIIENRVILSDKDQKIAIPKKLNIEEVLQWLLDQYNQLQTVALAVVCLISRTPKVLSEEFALRIVTPYIQLLRNLQLYQIASQTILMTKNKKYTEITEKDTKYNLSCGACKMSVSKGECKCNLLCVLCQGRLNQRMVIWCKYCGHGGHAQEYEKWFKVDKKKYCPYGCGHTCFTTDN